MADHSVQVNVYDDATDCARASSVPSSYVDLPSRVTGDAINIRAAGSQVAVKAIFTGIRPRKDGPYRMGASIEFCRYVAKFTPVPGRVYEARFDSNDEWCSIRVTEFGDAPSQAIGHQIIDPCDRTIDVSSHEVKEASMNAATTAEMASNSGIFWDLWAEAQGPRACATALDLMESDSDCTGNTCRAPMLLSLGYKRNCSIDPDARIRLSILTHHWDREIGRASSQCLLTIYRVSRGSAPTAELPPKCESSVKTETALYDAARRRVQRQVSLERGGGK